MERLLRDGGDLDSMDRSLLDYNPAAAAPAAAVNAATGCGVTTAAMNNGSVTSPSLPQSPPRSLPSVNGGGGGGGGNQVAMAPPPYDEGCSGVKWEADAAAGQDWISLEFPHPF